MRTCPCGAGVRESSWQRAGREVVVWRCTGCGRREEVAERAEAPPASVQPRGGGVRPPRDGRPQRRFVEHAEDAKLIGHLHGGRTRIAVTGDDVAAQALGADDEFFAEFTRTEKQDFFHAQARSNSAAIACICDWVKRLPC